MVPIASLWLPILLSAAAVFFLSSIIHMFLGYHNSDFSKVPNENQVMDDLRKANISPGDYVIPHAAGNKERNTQEFKDKMSKGPVAFMTVFPGGQMNMSKSLALWFIYCLIVGVFAAYIGGRALYPGANYLSVFQFVGATAFIGYGLALMQDSIWFNKKWSATFKNLFDALIYACFTAGIFGWLWP
jgi:hypothetical protein